MTRNTSFFDAVRQGDHAAVTEALNSDPSLANARDASGLSAVLLAAYSGQRETARLLAAHGAALSAFECIAVGDEPGLRALLAREPEAITRHTADGWTLLHGAAFFNRPDIARFLLERGADPRAVSANGAANQPIHAALAGRMSVAGIAMLLDAGADVNAQQHGGYTALHAAAMHGNGEIVACLLARGADPALPASDGRCAADFAQDAGHTGIAARLGRGTGPGDR